MLTETIAQSPVIRSFTPKEALNFPSAMAAIALGKRITKEEWENADYCTLRDGWLMINREGVWHRWVINDGDLMGEDWFVID